MWPEGKPVAYCEVCEVVKEFGSIAERNAYEISHTHPELAGRLSA